MSTSELKDSEAENELNKGRTEDTEVKRSRSEAKSQVTPTSTLTMISETCQRIGSLELDLSVVLGYGSHGTVVYRGSLNGRPVALKRMLSQFHLSADR